MLRLGLSPASAAILRLLTQPQGGLPTNALTLGGEPLTLGAVNLTLGA